MGETRNMELTKLSRKGKSFLVQQGFKSSVKMCNGTPYFHFFLHQVISLVCSFVWFGHVRSKTTFLECNEFLWIADTLDTFIETVRSAKCSRFVYKAKMKAVTIEEPYYIYMYTHISIQWSCLISLSLCELLHSYTLSSPSGGPEY